MAKLICPVRTCGLPLEWQAVGCACPRGHRFDRGRSGYVNLLQPQDRRAREPGDPRAAVQARRRTLERGLGDALLEALLVRTVALSLAPGAAVLDTGCGDGFYLAHLTERFGLEAWGADISTAAVDLAARRYPGARWIVANADRRMPFADASFTLLLSIAARKHGPEFRRLLAPGGRLLVAVPADDDLAELRAALYGRALAKDRGVRASELLGADFELEDEQLARQCARLTRDGIADVLAASYRGARQSDQARLASLPAELDVTLSTRLLCFRPRAESPS